MSELMDRGIIGMPFGMAMRDELSRRQFYGRAQAILTERDQLRAEVEALRKDAERWNKCKKMRKQWWLEAMTEAGRKGGRSLDESIDTALSAVTAERDRLLDGNRPTDARLDDMRRNGLSIDGDNAYKRDLMDSIIGALAFGKQRSTPPPAGHWLERIYEIGRAEADERDQLRARVDGLLEAVIMCMDRLDAYGIEAPATRRIVAQAIAMGPRDP